MFQLFSLSVLLIGLVGCNSSGTSLETDRPAAQTGIVWQIKAANAYPDKMILRLAPSGAIVFNSCDRSTMSRVTFQEGRTKVIINNMQDPGGANVGFQIHLKDVNCSPAEYLRFYNEQVLYTTQDVNGVRYVNFTIASEE